MKTASPFKGLDSYRSEDRHNFHGRDGDAERLISRILSSMLTLLYARSGAGKTSLLQAKVAPDLEKTGWTVVVTRPQRDPMRATRYDLLKSLAPPPDVERQAILRACRTLFPETPPGGLTLRDLIAGHQRLHSLLESTEADTETVNDALKGLLSPLRSAQTPAVGSGEVEHYYALFTRLLGGGLRPTDYLAHLAALSDGPQGPLSSASADSTRVEEILGSLETASGLYQGLMSSLDAPADSLVLFLQRLFTIYGRWRPDLRLVLVFDQFEELFTQYGHVDDGADAPEFAGELRLASYQLRDRFFHELAELYFRLFPQPLVHDDESAGGADAGSDVVTSPEFESPLQVRCVISIRQEFLAELDPIRQFVTELDQWSFHLDRLTPAAAKAVLCKATEKTPRPFHTALIDTIVSSLAQEERYVEPAELQVVVDRIWQEEEAPAEALVKLGGVRQILDLFLAEFLSNAKLGSEQKSDRDKIRIELLEILQALVSARGKNPTPIAALVGAPFRLKERREALLRLLEQGRLIRIEAREGTSIAEVRHDFLIRRILRTVRKELLENAEHGRFVSALAVLALCLRTERLLTWQEFEDLARNEANIHWDEGTIDGYRLTWTPAELMLRSALHFQDPLPELQSQIHFTGGERPARPVVADYLRNFAQRLKRPGAQFNVGSIPTDWQRDLLDHQQLTILNVTPDAWPLSREQLLVVIRSHVEWCDDATRPMIEYWTKRWKDEVTSRG